MQKSGRAKLTRRKRLRPWRPGSSCQAPGARLWYQPAGRRGGLPAVTLHGGPGLDHAYVGRALAPLEGRLDLAHLDLRGCGRSEGPGDFSGFDWRTWVDDVEALRRHLGVERWLVIGHSFGAALAVQYALEQPGRVSGLVLWAPCLAPAAPGERLARRPAAELEALGRLLGDPAQGDAAFRQRTLAALPAYFRRRPTPAQREPFVRAHLRAAPFDFAKRQVLPRLDLRPELQSVSAPTLVVAGDSDFLVSPQAAREIAGLLPHGRLTLLDRCGHFPGLERQRAFCAAVRGWLVQEGLSA